MKRWESPQPYKMWKLLFWKWWSPSQIRCRWGYMQAVGAWRAFQHVEHNLLLIVYPSIHRESRNSGQTSQKADQSLWMPRCPRTCWTRYMPRWGLLCAGTWRGLTNISRAMVGFFNPILSDHRHPDFIYITAQCSLFCSRDLRLASRRKGTGSSGRVHARGALCWWLRHGSWTLCCSGCASCNSQVSA